MGGFDTCFPILREPVPNKVRNHVRFSSPKSGKNVAMGWWQDVADTRWSPSLFAKLLNRTNHKLVAMFYYRYTIDIPI